MDDKKLQVEMHKDFFDLCMNAINNECYFEAMLMEYAAIEARLEVIMGIIGLPCNKHLSDGERRSINVSDRLKCLQIIQKESELFNTSKLPAGFFKKLEKWTNTRNKYIHGLYKNELLYKSRMKDIVDVSQRGYDYCKLLYNEAKRLRRLLKKEALLDIRHLCNGKQCYYIRNKQE